MRAATLPNDSEVLRLYEQAGGLVHVSCLLGAHTRTIRRILIANGVQVGPRGKSLHPHHHTQETRNRISLARKGHPGYWKGKVGPSKGKLMSEATKEKIRIVARERVGCLNGNWRGGVTPLNETIRKSDKYKSWHEGVMARDNYTCQICGQWGGELHADHIKPFSLFPELRFDFDNGRTLCRACHLTTLTYAGRLQQKGGTPCVH